MNEIKDSKKCLQRWLKRIQEKRPLLECLTNVVTINDVANVILACGASPVMADAADEVPDFVKGHYTTSFLEENKQRMENVSLDNMDGDDEEIHTDEDIAAIAAYFDYMVNQDRPSTSTTSDNRQISRWKEFGRRNNMRNYD